MSERKNFVKAVMALVIPMALQNLINVGVTASDVLMLGQLSEIELSGVSLAGQIQFVIQLMMTGLTSGAVVLTSQYWGKKDVRTIEKVIGIAMRFALIISLAVTLLVQFFPETAMRIFSDEEPVIQAGASYLKIVSLAYVLSNAVMIYLNIIRSVEKVIISTVVYGVSFVVNVIGNAILIFGLFGFPKMGVQGAAIATLSARIVEFLITAFYAVFINRVVRLHVKDLFAKMPLLFKDFLTYAVPVMINELFWSAGTAMNSVIIGHMGSEAAAASSVAQMTRQLAMVVSRGIAYATAIYLGKTIGAGKKEEAERDGKRFMKLSVISGLGSAAIILLVRPILPHFLNFTQESLDIFAFMMLVMAQFVFAQTLNTVMVVGIFRAGGDIKIAVYIDLFTMWFFTIPFGAIAAFLLNQSIYVVYALLLMDELVKVPIFYLRYRKKLWLKDVTRDN